MADLDDPARLAQFKTAITRLESDAVLDQCVQEAAERAEAPTAAVTFVMSKVQLLRASVGLPVELELTRATSRCDSFCQFVVRDETTFVVTDAKNDERVPQKMVTTFGIGAYLGVPIRAGGQVLGALCVADSRERSWRPGLADELGQLAARVSQRLDELSAAEAPGDHPHDLDALAAELAALAQVIQRTVSEMAPMVRLARGAQGMAPEALARAASVLTDVTGSYDDLLSAAERLFGSAATLKRALPRV